MTGKSDFNAEEWDKLVQAPALAALRVIAADRGGTLRESLSLARAYAEARQRGGSELLDAIVSSPPALDPSATRTPEQLTEQADQALRDAIGLLERKATPDEVEDYRRFVLAVADTVAHAHKEGGFLGIGGKEVSDSEQAVLDQLAETVGATSR
jgi:hypothetical protein